MKSKHQIKEDADGSFYCTVCLLDWPVRSPEFEDECKGGVGMKPPNDELTVYLSKEEIEMLGALAPENRNKVAAALLAQKIIRAKIDADLDEILRLKGELVRMGIK